MRFIHAPFSIVMSSMHKSTISQLALIKISGVDASSFLQGQLTNDVNQLDLHWHFSGYCSPKGRLLAMLRIWHFDDSYYALVAFDIVEPICKRLKMYVMRSKVEIAYVTNRKINFLADQQALRQSNLNSNEPTEPIAEPIVEHDSGHFLLSDPATQSYLHIEPHD